MDPPPTPTLPPAPPTMWARFKKAVWDYWTRAKRKLRGLPKLLDAILACAEMALALCVVFALGWAILSVCFGLLSLPKVDEGLKILDERWRAAVILAAVAFNRAARKFFENLEEAWIFKRSKVTTEESKKRKGVPKRKSEGG